MNGARLVMDGTPSEVFARSQELLDMGLDIPEVTKVSLKLRQMCLEVPQVYTVEQAVRALNSLRGGGADA